MKVFSDIFAKFLILIVGFAVLGLSITRASLEILAQDINESKLGNNPMSFVINYGEGVTDVGEYKLPEVGTLPINPMYGLKRVRDYFWLMLSRGAGKTKLALLMADKKTEETRRLLQLGKNNEALTAGNEAMDKLKYASQLVSQDSGNKDEVKQISKQIYLAGFAYREVFKSGANAFDMDQIEYAKLIQRNEDWNQNQKENKWTWDN